MLQSDPPPSHETITAERVAIVGVSRNEAKLGFRAARYAAGSTFQGDYVFVGRGSGDLLGRPLVSSLAEVDPPADVVVSCVPAAAVPDLVEQASAHGAHTVIVLGSGFAETGDDGARLQEELAATAARRGIRLIGPNSLGFVDFHTGLTATFGQGLDYELTPGPLAIVTQSGFLGSVIMLSAQRGGIGPSQYISTGNEAGFDFASAVEMATADPHTRMIAGYLEGGCTRRLLRSAVLAHQRGKPLVLLRGGRTTHGQQAARSHTAAMSSDSTVVDSALEKVNVVQVDDEFELVTFSQAVQALDGRPARRVAVVTLSGGVGILVADQLVAAGVELPPMSPDTRAAVRALLPNYASLGNPIDATANVLSDPGLIGRLASILAKDETFDAVIVALGMLQGREAEVVSGFKEVSAGTVMLLWPVASAEATTQSHELGLPLFETTRSLCLALGRYARWAERSIDPHVADVLLRDQGCIRARSQRGCSTWVSGQRSRELLSATIPLVAQREVADEDAALAAAADLGYPVAVKLTGDGLLHKSELGGVRLGVTDDQALVREFTELQAIGATVGDSAGIVIQSMTAPGIEVLLSVRQDDSFGTVLVLGTGGTATELRHDIVTLVAPFSRDEVRSALLSTEVGRLLAGYRGSVPHDVDAVVDVALRLAALQEQHSEVDEVEINPLIVHMEGEGCRAVDYLVRLNSLVKNV